MVFSTLTMLEPLRTDRVLTSLANSPDMSLFIFIAFPHSAEAAFVVFIYHIMPYDL